MKVTGCSCTVALVVECKLDLDVMFERLESITFPSGWLFSGADNVNGYGGYAIVFGVNQLPTRLAVNEVNRLLQEIE